MFAPTLGLGKATRATNPHLTLPPFFPPLVRKAGSLSMARSATVERLRRSYAALFLKTILLGASVSLTKPVLGSL